MTPRRYDLAVKFRLFRSLLGGGSDPDAERVYKWTIEKRSGHRMAAGLKTDKWKRSVDHYLISAKALLNAMAHEGFDPQYAIPVDPEGELLDGSHRLAAALVLKMADVPVVRPSTVAWAPAWGRQWFADQGMSVSDLERIERDWNALSDGNSR